MSALAMALTVAAGCATNRADIEAIRNPGAEIKAAPLSWDVVRTAAGRSSARRDFDGRKSPDVILAGAQEESRPPVNGSDGSPAESGERKLESRIQVPKDLPGANVPPLRSPKKTPENEVAYNAAINKLYPELTNPPPLDLGPEDAARPKLALSDFEQLALSNSPIIAQYQSDVAGQVGTAIQAGTHPNPIVGYEEDTVGSAGTRNYQGVYATQQIKTAGKLQLAQAIENVDLMNAQLALRQASNDLVSLVRRQYFALLIARESVRINEAIVHFTEELYRVQVDLVTEGQAAAYEPAYLRIFANQARGALVASQNRYTAAWKQLAATMNTPNMPVPELVDRPDMPVPLEDYDASVAHVLSLNTEIRTARNGPLKARLVLRLAEVTPIPDIYAYFTLQKDFTTPGLNRATYNAQFGVPLPIFDRNKGNILAARGFLVRATEEVPRVENDLRSRLADAFERFETNRVLVNLQRDQILPDAVRAYRGTYQRHLQVPDDVGFADVVVAQQSLLTSVTQYILMLTEQWNAFVDIAALLQIESLKELQLQLKEKDTAPEPLEGARAQDVSRIVANILTVPKAGNTIPGKPTPANDERLADKSRIPQDK